MSEAPRTKALLDERCRTCKLYQRAQAKKARQIEIEAKKKARQKKIEEEKRLSRLGIDPRAKGVINEPHGDPYGEDPRDPRRRPRGEYGGSWW